jgi:D-serine deaminase-like pyridoxal phosphate-dependent protein
VDTAALCRRDGIALTEISVGSTPTARTGAFVDGVTEIRPGTYALNDATMMRLGVATEATAAARVLVTVAGRPDLHMDFLSEEHGVGHLGGDGLRIGERLQVIPSHVATCAPA